MSFGYLFFSYAYTIHNNNGMLKFMYINGNIHFRF